ncbi:Hypothetical predicted protein [Cloeon dipterum]|uniref:Transmembrane protein 221 n=1 Tax=Cloeon dipterum TaxID=197152 RepID=A0A8S1BR09_9INSE|nr:Hypothetical predicted protein [Cloeon dipterum]
MEQDATLERRLTCSQAAQPLQLPQPPASIRNPWVAGADSDEHSSRSSSVTPPRPPVRQTRRNSVSSAASSKTASRNFAAPGCCSPGVQLVCYYCLRAALLCSLLSGCALTLAGAVLRHQEHEDLGVLLYIGVLVALVSFVLLVVQWRSRRPSRLRPRALPLQVPAEAVPLQELRQHQHHVSAMPLAGHQIGINPYYLQHSLTIPQHSSRSERTVEVTSSRMLGRIHRPASVVVPPGRPENPMHQMTRLQLNPLPGPSSNFV